LVEAGRGLAQEPIRVRDDSLNLIYLDPPFNSDASYNVLFRLQPTNIPRRRSKRSKTL
jgi:16S rRNA G966 N2-methylase RsmD